MKFHTACFRQEHAEAMNLSQSHRFQEGHMHSKIEFPCKNNDSYGYHRESE